jgi:hypothetical protein
MRHRHIRAKNNQWVHVHRCGTRGGGVGGDWTWLMIKIFAVVLLIYFLLQALPWIIAACMLCGAAKVFLRLK